MMQFNSYTLRDGWKDRYGEATDEQKKFVDHVYWLCETNYKAGGSQIVETYEPSEILSDFSNLGEVVEFIALRVNEALNQRWGEDDDPQLEMYERFNNADWSRKP
jgi:hypothetical protein